MTRAPLDVAALRRRLLAPAGPLARLDVVDETGSTNADLRAAAGSWPAPALLVAEHQSAGRGRAGRAWQTPPGAALAASFLLAPRVPPTALGWVPLLTGLAVVRALARHGITAWVKWPNDVLLADDVPLDGFGAFRKVAGILAEVVPGAGPTGTARVVVGVGLNVDQTADELPVPTATSLALTGGLAGDGPERSALLVTLVEEVTRLVADLESAGGDARAVGISAAYATASCTVGATVRAELAGGSAVVVGQAVRVADDGALVLATPAGERVVTAGDVHHLRLR
ncbi:biotin--[acetyl-CoA-carboxylase] ligase [Isoptericola jiangsuensis]|uniref:biotin--[acetyl-CoA-carboxylase] ligase n=1 Tax=Isoptericola jiangsuensis TaxID=548579 RepID=UPI003AAABCF3